MIGTMKKVQYIHLRARGCVKSTVWIDSNDHSKGKKEVISCNNILPRGGATICYLPNNEEGNAKIGVAVCSPHDNYNKKIGRGIAFSSAKNSEGFYDLLTYDEAIESGMFLIKNIIQETVSFKQEILDRWIDEEDAMINEFNEMSNILSSPKHGSTKV